MLFSYFKYQLKFNFFNRRISVLFIERLLYILKNVGILSGMAELIRYIKVMNSVPRFDSGYIRGIKFV